MSKTIILDKHEMVIDREDYEMLLQLISNRNRRRNAVLDEAKEVFVEQGSILKGVMAIEQLKVKDDE